MKNVHIGWGPVGMTKIIAKDQTKLKLSNSLITLELESSHQLVINSTYEETPIWKSSNESVVKVDQNGLVTAVGYGTAYITVTSGNLKGTCVVSIPKPDEPEIPDEPTSKLDNTKIYYGTIKSPDFRKYSDMTEDDVVSAVELGSLVTAPIAEIHTTVNVTTPYDAVVILIPTTDLKAVKQANKKPFQETMQSYEGTGANGNVKLGDFYVYGEILIVAGNLEIHVE